jgi:hypothetical protein
MHMKSRYMLLALGPIGRLATIVAAIIAAVPPALLGQLPAPSAQISGTVTDDAGNPLAGVMVTYTLAPDPTVSQSPSFYAGTITDATGAFSSALLPAGTYLLCGIAAPAVSVQDNCEWTLFPPKVTLADGQVVTGVALVMPKGMSLTIRINDPAGLATNLLDPAKKGQGNALLTQVWDERGFVHSLPLRSFDATGQNLSLVVPFGGQFKLSLSGQKLAITDKNGTAIPAGTNILFQSVKTVPTIQYQFTIRAAL